LKQIGVAVIMLGHVTEQVKKRSDSRWFWILRISVGIGILILLVLWLGAESVVSQLGRLNWVWLAWHPLLLLLNLVIGGIGLFALFRPFVTLSLREFLRYHFFTQSLGAFLPLQLGESSLVLLLKRHGVPLTRSLGFFLTDKATSLIALGAVGGLAFIVWLPIPADCVWIGLGVILLTLVGGVIVVRFDHWSRVDRFLRRAPSSRIYLPVRTLLEELAANRKGIAVNLTATAVRRTLLEPLMQFVIFTALGTPVPLGMLILVSNLLGIVGLAPITAQGLGVIELTAVYLFSLIQVDAATTATAYLLARPLALGFSGIVLVITGALLGWPHSQNDPVV